MATKRITAETGANGTVLATSGSYGGDPVDLISKGGGGNLTLSNAQAARGSQSIRVVTTGATDTALLRFTGGATNNQGTHFDFRLDAIPGATTVLCQTRHASGPICAIQITSAAKLQFTYPGGTAYTTTASLSANTWYRASLYYTVGTTTTGTLQAAVYLSGSSSPIETGVSLTGINNGTNPPVGAQIGKTTTAGSAINGYFDDFRIDDSATGLLPVETNANAAPTANAGADQANVEPWATVTLNGTDADSDGTITSRVWTKGGVTQATTASFSYTAPATEAGITETFTYTVTDNAGATGSDTVQVTVLPATEFAVIGGVLVPMQIVEV